MELVPIRIGMKSFIVETKETSHFLKFDCFAFNEATIRTRKDDKGVKTLRQILDTTFGSKSMNDAMPPYDLIAFIDDEGCMRQVSGLSGNSTTRTAKLKLFDQGQPRPRFDVNSYAIAVNEWHARLRSKKMSVVFQHQSIPFQKIRSKLKPR